MHHPHLPLRHLLLALLALLLVACAGKPPAPRYDVPREVTAYIGETRDDAWTNPDGYRIAGRYWLPDGEPRAVVLLVHGTAMHGGLYDEFGRYLAARGYVAYAIDLQGWGRSEGIGERGDVLNHDMYVTDVALVGQRLRGEFPGTPLFMFGESLGGTVLLLGMAERRLAPDGLVLSAPGYKPAPALLGLRAPALIADWANGMAGWVAGKVPSMPLVHTDLALRAIIADDEVQARMLADPHVPHGFLPARYVSALVEAVNFIEPRLESVNVPLLVVQGRRDELVPPRSAEEVYRRALVRDKEYKLYDQLGHAVMLQRERYDAMRHIGRWLDARTLPARDTD